MMIRIVSDGPCVHQTHVEDAETGEIIEGVIAVTWEAHVGDAFATATLTFDQVLINVVPRLSAVYAKTCDQVEAESSDVGHARHRAAI